MLDPGIQRAIERDLSRAGLASSWPGWAFYCVTLAEDPTGARGGRFTVVDADGASRVDVGFDWTDHELGYRLELFTVRATIAPEGIPDTARIAGLDGIPRAVLYGRAIPPRGGMFAQFEWRPGEAEAEYSYGGVNPHASRSDNDTAAAYAGLSLLGRFTPPTGGVAAMSNEAAFAEAVRFGSEWLDDHPDKIVRDLRSKHLAARKCIEAKSYEKWMTEKRFGIKAVRARLVELRGEK